MPVQRAEGHLIEVDESKPAAPRSCQCCSGVRADATASDDYDEGFAKLGESVVGQEDAVARELFEDEVFVVVA